MGLTLSLLAAPPTNKPNLPNKPAKSAYFLIADIWDFPDEHGQGIEGLRFYENSTGSWVAHPFYMPELGAFYFLHDYDDGYILNWTVGTQNTMKIRVYCLFNQTLVGVSSTAEGQNYIRHSVNVSRVGNASIWSQQNFTYYDVTEFGDENYYYEYEVILNFIPLEATIYTISITYEIYYAVM